jgi:hypothetical protein
MKETGLRSEIKLIIKVRITPTKFTKEVEANDTFLFFDISIMKRGPKLAKKVYQTPTHTGRYLHFKSNHPHHVKRGVIHSLIS